MKAAECVLVVAPVVDFTLDVVQAAPISRELTAAIQLRVRNTGNAPLEIELVAEEEQRQLEIEHGMRQLTVPSGKEQAIQFTVGPREPKLGVTSAYELSITATAVGTSPPGDTEPGHAARTVSIPVQFALPTIDAPALDPRSIDLMGETGTALLVLGNRASFPITVELKGGDANGALRFTFGENSLVTLPPGDMQRVPVTITASAPARSDTSSGVIPFIIYVSPIQPSGGQALVQGEIRLTSAAEIEIKLDPELTNLSGDTAEITVLLSNPGTQPATVKLQLQDDARLYRISFAEGAVQHLAPGEAVTVMMTLECTDTSRLERGRRPNAINLSATPVSPPGKPVFAKGLILVPSRRSQFIQLLLISVAVWFLGIVLSAVDAFGLGGWAIALAIPLGPIIGGAITKTWKFVSALFLGLIALILILVLIIIIAIARQLMI